MTGVAKSRIDKHIAYWLTLPDVDKEQFRREWPWLASLYDVVVRKYVGSDIGIRNSYIGLARAAQINDHMHATRGNTLPAVPSLSKPENKQLPGSRLRAKALKTVSLDG